MIDRLSLKIIISNYDSLKNPYYGGGGARAVHETARRLAQAHTVQVIAGAYPGAEDEVIDGVRYRYIGTRFGGGRLGQLAYSLGLLRAVRHEVFDLWIESLTPPFSLVQLPRFTNRPVIFWVQIWVGQAMWRRYRVPITLYERFALRVYRWGVVTSRYLKEQFIRMQPHLQLAVIPNGVRTEWLKAEWPTAPRSFLFVGRIEPVQKGLDLLIEAVRLLGSRLTEPVRIVGRGTPSNERWLSRRLQTLNPPGMVQWIRGADAEQLAKYFQEALALVLPSRYEASPLVIPEAFAFGVPVILSAIPELLEYPDDACMKFHPGSAAQLAEAMLRLQNDRALRQQMSLAARAYADQYNWDLLVGRFEQFLCKVYRDSKAV